MVQRANSGHRTLSERTLITRAAPRSPRDPYGRTQQHTGHVVAGATIAKDTTHQQGTQRKPSSVSIVRDNGLVNFGSTLDRASAIASRLVIARRQPVRPYRASVRSPVAANAPDRASPEETSWPYSALICSDAWNCKRRQRRLGAATSPPRPRGRRAQFAARQRTHVERILNECTATERSGVWTSCSVSCDTRPTKRADRRSGPRAHFQRQRSSRRTV